MKSSTPNPASITTRSGRRREQGIALIVSILMLVLVGTIAMNMISSSEQELTAGGRSRSTSKSLYAADAGIQFAENRLRPPSDVSKFKFTLDDGTLVKSGKRTDAVEQDIEDTGIGTPPSGYSINIGQGFVNETYKVNVTATRTGIATAEVEVRLGILTTNAGTY